MGEEVFLLTLNVAVFNDLTLLAADLAWLLADGTNAEMLTYLIICAHFIWHEALVVTNVWVRAESQ